MHKHINIYVSCFLLGLFGLFVFSCQSDNKLSDEYDPAMNYGVDTLIAVILSPAGANVAYKYDFKEKGIYAPIDSLSNLPYPVNIGFLHQNVNNKEVINRLSAIIIGKQIPTLKPIGVEVVGAVEVSNDNNSELYILTTPNDSNYSSLEINNFGDLITTHDAFKYQLQHFLQNQKGAENVSTIKWHDEKYANQLISKNKSIAN